MGTKVMESASVVWRLTFALWLGSLVADCSKARQGAEFVPLTKRMRCEYEVEAQGPFGVQKGKNVLRADGEETISGKTYIKVVTVSSGFPGAESQTDYYRMTGTGLFRVSGKHKDQPEFLEMPFPLAVGTTWTLDHPDRSCKCKAEALETLELIDKSYKGAIRVSKKCNSKTGQKLWEATAYYAPNVGEARTTWRDSASVVESKLQSCSF